MQVIGMLGYVDKYDFVINLAKVLNIMNRSVLVIDATLDRKMKYVIPALDNIGKAYITQYDGIDFAVGFDSMHDIENYTCEQGINIGLYDYLLIDIDSPKAYEFFRARGIDKHLFFIDTGLLSVAKNKDIIKAIRVYNPELDSVKLTKILFRAFLSRASTEYLENQIGEYNVVWDEQTFEVPSDERDKMINVDSQFGGVISIKKHTKPYIELLSGLASQLLGDSNTNEVKKEIKRRKE